MTIYFFSTSLQIFFFSHKTITFNGVNTGFKSVLNLGHWSSIQAIDQSVFLSCFLDWTTKYWALFCKYKLMQTAVTMFVKDWRGLMWADYSRKAINQDTEYGMLYNKDNVFWVIWLALLTAKVILLSTCMHCSNSIHFILLSLTLANPSPPHTYCIACHKKSMPFGNIISDCFPTKKLSL